MRKNYYDRVCALHIYRFYGLIILNPSASYNILMNTARNRNGPRFIHIGGCMVAAKLTNCLDISVER